MNRRILKLFTFRSIAQAWFTGRRRLLIRIRIRIPPVTGCLPSAPALQWARLGEVVGAIAIGTAAEMSPSTTTTILTETISILVIEIRLTTAPIKGATDPVRVAAIGNTIRRTAAERLMVIAELPTSSADEPDNNLPAVRATAPAPELAREILAAQIALAAELAPEGLAVDKELLAEIDRVAAREILAERTVQVAEPAREILAAQIALAEARALQLDRLAEVHSAAVVEIALGIAVFHPAADLAPATAHSAAAADSVETLPDLPVAAADGVWAVADLAEAVGVVAAAADAAVEVAVVVAAADDGGKSNVAMRKNK